MWQYFEQRGKEVPYVTLSWTLKSNSVFSKVNSSLCLSAYEVSPQVPLELMAKLNAKVPIICNRLLWLPIGEGRM